MYNKYLYMYMLRSAPTFGVDTHVLHALLLLSFRFIVYTRASHFSFRGFFSVRFAVIFHRTLLHRSHRIRIFIGVFVAVLVAVMHLCAAAVAAAFVNILFSFLLLISMHLRQSKMQCRKGCTVVPRMGCFSSHFL